jgi:membrane-associated phospholipid phosphatase
VSSVTDKRAGRIDPAVEAAPPRGWRRWAKALLTYQQERLASFGGLLLLGFVMGVLVLYAFAWLANEVLAEQTLALDRGAGQAVRAYTSPAMDVAMRTVSLFGSEAVPFIGVLLIGILLLQRRWGAPVLLVLVVSGAQLLNDVLKGLFHRTRPAPVAGWISAQQWSFPSGHAMVSAAFYLCVAYLTWRLVRGPWRIVLLCALGLLVVLIGVSRIYLEAHYLSDVIAGYMAGFMWTDIVIIGSRVLIPRRGTLKS